MTKQSLKEKLLLTNQFVDNKYLDEYVELICNNQGREKTKFKTQEHHIIPRCLFSTQELEVDNSSNNLVNLLFKDHVIAHYLLSLCTEDKLKFLNETAFFAMSSRKYFEELTEYELSNIQELYEDFCKRDSELNSGELNGNFGHYWTQEQRDKASQQKKLYYQQHPEIVQYLRDKKQGVSPANKGLKAFYSQADGSIIYADTCPCGYTSKMPEELRKSYSERSKGNTSTKGMRCYTDGTSNTTCYEGQQPEGFILGKIFDNPPTGVKGKKRIYDSNGNSKYINSGESIPDGYTSDTPIFVKEQLRAKFSGSNNPMFGKQQKDSTKQLISQKAKGRNVGEKNGVFGKHWYTDGIYNIYDRIELSDCPSGFNPGVTRGSVHKAFTLDKFLEFKGDFLA